MTNTYIRTYRYTSTKYIITYLEKLFGHLYKQRLEGLLERSHPSTSPCHVMAYRWCISWSHVEQNNFAGPQSRHLSNAPSSQMLQIYRSELMKLAAYAIFSC